MTEEEARSLMKHLGAAMHHLDEALALTETLSIASEAKSVRETLIQGTGLIACDVVAPIIDLYPTLDPFPGSARKR